MDKNKIYTALNLYEDHLKSKGSTSKKHISKKPPTRQEAFNHSLYMIEEIKEFIKQDKLQKAFRWLGFIQSLLWIYGEFSLDDLKNHNRSHV